MSTCISVSMPSNKPLNGFLTVLRLAEKQANSCPGVQQKDPLCLNRIYQIVQQETVLIHTRMVFYTVPRFVQQ